MRKIVPPTTPARPPAVPASAAKVPPTPAAPSAPYGARTRSHGDPQRFARVAFYVTLAYTLGVIAWRSVDTTYLRLTWGTMRGVSLGEPFVVCCWGFALAPVVMAVANVLAVLAFFLASRGRYAGNVLITYALCQVTLALILFSSVFTLISLGTIKYEKDGHHIMVQMGRGSALQAAVIAAGLCVPLVAFLIPRLRRACFNSAND